MMLLDEVADLEAQANMLNVAVLVTVGTFFCSILSQALIFEYI